MGLKKTGLTQVPCCKANEVASLFGKEKRSDLFSKDVEKIRYVLAGRGFTLNKATVYCDEA